MTGSALSDDTFDFVIVGGGSAGCVLAARLSADPANRVLLLEAGGRDDSRLMQMPLACGSIFYDPAMNWSLASEPEVFADERIIHPAAGRVLGGGSSINGMIYTRGHRLDYDQWAQMGCRGWSFGDVLPSFKRAECNWRGASRIHGGSGPLTTSPLARDGMFAAITDTARRAGLRVTDDFERDDPDGFGLPDITTHGGRRASTARRYLHQVWSRKNLVVKTNVCVTRIVMERSVAVGVEYAEGGDTKRVEACREVVLSAGAYGSPKLLMLSGIGPADEIAAVGITPIIDLPFVGRNLQEHPGTTLTFGTKAPMQFDRELRLDRLISSVARWWLTGSGPVSTLPISAMAFVRTRPELERPDVELLFTPASLTARVWFPGWRKPNGATLAISAFLMRPASRGSVSLRSPDPHAPPRIHLNLLGEPEDKATLLAAMRMVREFMAREPVASLVERELSPGRELMSDEALLSHLRRTIRTMQHPTSTCAMGIGDDAVTDPELRVRGAERLRVVDASVMPQIVGGHTNAPTIMIAEKAADMILGRSGSAEIQEAA
ncbi:GMC family oxidoreductase [Bradyrhizobium sp. USDA 4471]